MSRRSNKKKSKVIPTILVFIFIFAFIGLVLFLSKKIIPKDNKKTENKVEKIDKIENYNYNLYKNSSKLYQKYYEELKKVLSEKEIDEEKYAKLIAELFIIDFYSLDTHITNQDVGGLDFIYSSIKENFSLKATDTIYKFVESNVYGDRKQKLPMVKEITKVDILSKNYSYTSNDKKTIINDNKAYYVDINWTYEDNSSKYQTKATITIVHEKDNLLSIVSVK